MLKSEMDKNRYANENVCVKTDVVCIRQSKRDKSNTNHFNCITAIQMET